LRDRLLGGVGKRERNVSSAHPSGKLGRLAVECDSGPASGLAGDFDVTPAHAMVPAGAERFHGCFLGGEAGGVTFHSIGLGIAVAYLAFGEHAAEESVTMAGKGLRDARNFRDVDPSADDHQRLR